MRDFFHNPNPFDYASLGLQECGEDEEYDGETCVECQMELRDELYLSDGLDIFCFDCANAIIESVSSEAVEFAEDNCKFTVKELPTFDPTERIAPTREEYAAGIREAYTENSFRCHLRHNCTNYHALIRDLSKYNLRDRIKYAAIRQRIDEMTNDERIRELTRYPWEIEPDEEE